MECDDEEDDEGDALRFVRGISNSYRDHDLNSGNISGDAKTKGYNSNKSSSEALAYYSSPARRNSTAY